MQTRNSRPSAPSQLAALFKGFQLRPREKRALIAFLAEGKTCEEIARDFGVTKGAIEARIYRLRLRARRAGIAIPTKLEVFAPKCRRAA